MACAGLLRYAQRYITVGMTADLTVSRTLSCASSIMLQVRVAIPTHVRLSRL